MIKFFKILAIAFSLMAISILPSKAFIMDVWEVRGADPADVAGATSAFKEKAMAGGAKYTAFRSSIKIRGENSNDTTFIYGYYDSYEDQMSTQALIMANPDWLESTFGSITPDEVNSVTWANSTESAGEPAAGQTVAYATLEVESGINFLLNFPMMQKMMSDAGAPVVVDAMTCAMCPAGVLPANSMIYFSSANPADMGKALDIFASEEMQRWMFANMGPHMSIVDQGVVVFQN
tara:strand:+ start:286 stop:987 length:702 start_codon:yes stop_codon:yes gene_type:complete